MKIAFLSEKYTPDIGGLAISAQRLVRLLASAGHDVRVFAPTLNLPASERRTLRSNGISVTRLGAHKRVDDTLVDWFELLVEEHNREPFDVLHAYFLSQAGFVAAYAGNYLNVSSVVSARGNDLERAVFDPARSAHILYALEHASAVTTNTNELAKKATALMPGRQVTVILNGIDSEHFRPLPRNNALAQSLNLMSEGQVAEASRVIGFAGELREKKGLRPLLSAYAQVNDKNPATLLIVGNIRAGEDKQFFENFQLAHSNMHMVVTGFVPHSDLPAYYSLIDVFVQPSLRDGLPNALLEAMACGRAVVGTPVGGIKDVLIDGENGRFVSTNDAEALADTLNDLLIDDDFRNKLGTAACQTITNEFTLQMELDTTIALYRQLGLKM